MPVETATAMAAVSLPMLVGLGWTAAVLCLILGRVRRSSALLGTGQILSGVMLLATLEAFYLHDAYANGGNLVVQADDLLALGLLGMAGGLLAMLGFSRVWSRPSTADGRARTSAAPPAKR